MEKISIDFRKFPENPIINSDYKLNDNQILALGHIPPYVDKLNLNVEFEGHHILIKNATSQYFDNEIHNFSKEIPMIRKEIEDMLYHSSDSNIREFLTNDIPE